MLNVLAYMGIGIVALFIASFFIYGLYCVYHYFMAVIKYKSLFPSIDNNSDFVKIYFGGQIVFFTLMAYLFWSIFYLIGL